VLIVEVKDPLEWNNMVLSSSYTSPTHFFSEADYHLKIILQGEVYLVPFKVSNFYGSKILISYGTRADCGIAPLGEFHYLNQTVKKLVDYLRQRKIDAFNLTFKKYYMKEYVDKVTNALSPYLKYVIIIYARILSLTNEFNYIWTHKFNKKARNLVKKFKKLKGRVEILDNPLDYLEEIMETNLSVPVRQGRPMPRSYTDKRLVAKSLESSLKEKGKCFRVYGAFIQNKLVGYSYVVEHNGYAYISRFLTHAKYFKYAVSNGLISAIIEDLCRRNVRIVQYGYWDKYYRGVNHFLEQYGFEKGRVEAYFIPLTRKGNLALKAFKLIHRVKNSLVGKILKDIRKSYYKVIYTIS